LGAAARKWFVALALVGLEMSKHDPAHRSSGTTDTTASDTEGNMARGAVSKMVGSSASLTNWLNVKPVGPISGTNVDGH
jgi:hypothetical protein